jgi:putative addiction module component (TIGR02574 family)
MAASLAELERQAQLLSAEDRARLAELLLESLRGTSLADIEVAWKREIEARVAAYDRGDLQAFPAEDVFAEAKRIVR